MNTLDERMILGVNYALHQQKVDVQTLLKDISLEDFVNKLRAHSIEALVYSALSDPNTLNNINGEAANHWKKNTLFSTLYQQKHMTQIEIFFKSCNEAHIPVIALKGLLLRELYPNPNTRTMCDADILVHEEDLDAIRIVLTQLGYAEEVEDSPSDHHLTFFKPNHFNIEIHWTLNTSLTNRNTDFWESQIWERCKPVQFGHTLVFSLSLEDHLIFLCLHMLSHIKFYGFGIRQLCDFYLFIEHFNSQLNWNLLNALIKRINISNLFCYIINTCKNLFHLHLTEYYELEKKVSPNQLNYFIDTLLQGGVYGFEDKKQVASIMLSHLNTDSHIKGIFKVIFPSIKRLSNHYPYVSNYLHLYPIAWLQNLWRLLTRNDFSLYHKFFTLFLSSKTTTQRNRLLKELDS